MVVLFPVSEGFTTSTASALVAKVEHFAAETFASKGHAAGVADNAKVWQNNLYRTFLFAHIAKDEDGAPLASVVYETLKERNFIGTDGKTTTFEKKYGGAWRGIRSGVQAILARHNDPIAAPRKGVNGARKGWKVNGVELEFLTFDVLCAMANPANECDTNAVMVCKYVNDLRTTEAKESDKEKKERLERNILAVDAYISHMKQATRNADEATRAFWGTCDARSAFVGLPPFDLPEAIEAGNAILAKRAAEAAEAAAFHAEQERKRETVQTVRDLLTARYPNNHGDFVMPSDTIDDPLTVIRAMMDRATALDLEAAQALGMVDAAIPDATEAADIADAPPVTKRKRNAA